MPKRLHHLSLEEQITLSALCMMAFTAVGLRARINRTYNTISRWRDGKGLCSVADGAAMVAALKWRVRGIKERGGSGYDEWLVRLIVREVSRCTKGRKTIRWKIPVDQVAVAIGDYLEDVGGSAKAIEVVDHFHDEGISRATVVAAARKAHDRIERRNGVWRLKATGGKK